MDEDELRAVTIGEPRRLTGRIEIADYDPGWPAGFARGYALRIREPRWHEHRLLEHTDPATNLHVFSRGCPEIDRMLQLRDWLRTHDADRDLYARTKRELVRRDW